MIEKLRDQLIGAWELVSFVQIPINASTANCPLGEQPVGIIMYTSDGYMSAQLMRSNPGHFASADWFKATPEEYARAASTYFAYAGPFDVDEESSTVTHSVAVSLFPNWIGKKQHRIARIEGDTLWLSTASPMQSAGQSVNADVQWRRLMSDRMIANSS